MEKKYRVNESLAMNLGSMLTHLQVLSYEFKNGKVTAPVKRVGRVLKTEADCWELHNELMALPGFGMYATSKEYGMLVQIQRERTHSRDMANYRCS